MLIGMIGVAILYSAAGGSWGPWAQNHGIRFGAGLIIMLTLVFVNIAWVYRVAPFLYIAMLCMILLVEFIGLTGSGAQRWLGVGSLRIQPSELMKITIVLFLAWYFHRLSHEEVGRIRYLIVPLIAIALPTFLVLRQPDLGTATVLFLGGGALFFLAGVRIWKFVLAGAGMVGAVFVVWQFHILAPYQENRIRTFLDPDTDPLGSGYHITQSKIALGSGGLTGKGYIQGTQSNLNFLPEKHTDFVLSVMAEEFGMLGMLTVMTLYFLLIFMAFVVATGTRATFARLIASGVGVTLFIYFFVNLAMVMSLVPVVGIPLPMISYGGTAMLTAMLGIGLVLNMYRNRGVWLSRTGAAE
ncbi:MAG: rod shape-determining protein RodA [Alphaproteobacteria bacterium]|nr:rod shape-determining protein RodA [Alphaproteobacteria bacterium]